MRAIHEIAREIERTWAKVNYAARPYLDALKTLESVEDNFYLDPGQEMISYFLSNASSFRGPEAKRLKAELKQHSKYHKLTKAERDLLAAYKENS